MAEGQPPQAAVPPVAAAPPCHVGVDVSKARLDACVLPAGRTLWVANDDAGVRGLVEFLRPLAPQLVVVEATGRYHRRLAADLLAASPRSTATRASPAGRGRAAAAARTSAARCTCAR